MSRCILLRMRNDADKSCRKNQYTYFVFSNYSEKFLCLRYNVEQNGTARQATDDDILQRTRIACWITKTTDTYSVHEIINAFPPSRRRLSVTFMRVYHLASLTITAL